MTSSMLIHWCELTYYIIIQIIIQRGPKVQEILSNSIRFFLLLGYIHYTRSHARTHVEAFRLSINHHTLFHPFL